MDYKLIACDMDATALTTDKRLTPKTIEKMEAAIAAGKHVIFSTGRNLSLVLPYMRKVRGMRYAVTGAGAAVNDVVTGARLYERNIDPDTVKLMIAAACGKDTLPVIYIGNASYCPAWAAERAGEFHVPDFSGAYRNYMEHPDDVFGFYMENPAPVQKFNLLFTDRETKDSVYEKIKTLPITFTSMTDTVMEINAKDISKAEGLEALCAHLGIGMDECAAVGDSDNDVEMLKAVGYGVAMGNAVGLAREAADAIVGDCDHDGAAEAIDMIMSLG